VQQSLLVQLKNLTGYDDLVPLHRIDRETAGLVLLEKHPADRDAYHALFRQQHIHKTYYAVAAFRADLTWPRTHTSRLMAGEPFFRMQEVPGQPNSETRISLLRTDGSRALYQLEPVSARAAGSVCCSCWRWACLWRVTCSTPRHCADRVRRKTSVTPCSSWHSASLSLTR
jgi:tRNA pseudouridine32 synthase/23S rRNA pseudouridine746 synthase